MTSLHVAPLRGLNAPSPTIATMLTSGLEEASVATLSFVSTTAFAICVTGKGVLARRRLGLWKLGALRRWNLDDDGATVVRLAMKGRKPALKLAISRDIFCCPEKNSERGSQMGSKSRRQLLLNGYLRRS
ncbi:uncharacterized protein J3R85_002753 [Psidium guajava]|nr:uncharacterized protein J3R85_002753 [Psidium guajava]